MKKIIIPFTLLFILAAIASCRKNDAGNNNNNTNTYTSLKAALATVAPATKTVNIDAAAGGSFYGNSGTRYIFPANAFITTGGAAVTGNVQIAATEYLNKSAMIFSGVTTYTTEGTLYSAGEIQVNANQNGQQLSLSPGLAFTANMPQPGAPQGMYYFHGQPTDSNVVVWTTNTKARDTVAAIVYNGDTVSIISDSLHYCNADMFMGTPNYQTFTIIPSIAGITITDSADMKGYSLYDNYNGVWGMQPLSGGQITEEHVPNIPVHFVMVAVINGNFYGGILAATPATGSTYTVTLTQTTPQAFKVLVDAL